MLSTKVFNDELSQQEKVLLLTAIGDRLNLIGVSVYNYSEELPDTFFESYYLKLRNICDLVESDLYPLMHSEI